jgi:tetratricopeptide (TPR) repeat protein
VALFEDLMREREHADDQADLGRAMTRRAYARAAARQWVDAVADYQRAVDCFAAALARSGGSNSSGLSEELGQVANDLAWILATHPSPRLRDAAKARDLAHRACDITSFGKWEYLDTLAAAHARQGDFTKALELQRRAITLAGSTACEPLQHRLAAYESADAFTDPSDSELETE